jgi:hypothetical protein
LSSPGAHSPRQVQLVTISPLAILAAVVAPPPELQVGAPAVGAVVIPTAAVAASTAPAAVRARFVRRSFEEENIGPPELTGECSEELSTAFNGDRLSNHFHRVMQDVRGG